MISCVIRAQSDVINELIANSRWGRRPKSRARLSWQLGTRRLAGYGSYETIFVLGRVMAFESKHGHIQKGPFQPTG